MSEIEFFAPGVPATKGSTKSFRCAGTGKIRTKGDNPRTKPWQRVVAQFALYAQVKRAPRGQGVSLEVEFVLPRPKGHLGTGRNAGQLKPSAPKRHTSKPDVDKLTRAILDALTGVAYVDDSQVDVAPARKRYADPGEEVGARIWVSS